ncbi:MAG: alpha/beta fold hydrolase [Alphaproteobacteria bacterium]|nr:alpha/beta fold hydrolase [Alphaproteobacteria bacterium]
MTWSERRVTHGETDLLVRQVGQAGRRDVVMLPSLGRGSHDFDDLAARVAEAGYRVTLPEPRGIGGSTGPLAGQSLHDFANDVAAVIASAVTPPVTLIGHAYGNRVARTVAADHPALVDRLVLIASGGIVPIRPHILEAMRGCLTPTLPRAERLQHLQTAFFAPGNDPAVWLDGWWPEAAAAQSAAVRATNTEDWWEAGGKPIVVLQASDDAIAPRANAEDLKRRLGERVSIVDITGAGHAMLPEQPQQIADAVLAALK